MHFSFKVHQISPFSIQVSEFCSQSVAKLFLTEPLQVNFVKYSVFFRIFHLSVVTCTFQDAKASTAATASSLGQ